MTFIYKWIFYFENNCWIIQKNIYIFNAIEFIYKFYFESFYILIVDGDKWYFKAFVFW